MSRSAPPLGLLAIVALAVVGFAFAPAPPSAPPMDAEEIAAIQRGIDRLVDDTRAWQHERGDLVRPWAQADGHLAILIDDVGRELHLFEQLLDLRFRLSFAVLPGSTYAPGAQLRLVADRRRYREILLHLPMEPLEHGRMAEGDDAHETFLVAGDDAATLRSKLEDALLRVPAAIGVNNHMGSRLSADRAAMDAIMPVLGARGLFFVDSRTIADSVAESAARDAGVPAAARQVFLDDDPSIAAIERELDRAVTLSRTRPVIAIAHSSPAVLDVLLRRLPQVHDAGIGVYPVSDIVRHVQTRPVIGALEGHAPPSRPSAASAWSAVDNAYTP